MCFNVLQGTPEKLMSQLVEVEKIVDPTYVEDFLLTHRTFLHDPLIIANKLLEWLVFIVYYRKTFSHYFNYF